MELKGGGYEQDQMFDRGMDRMMQNQGMDNPTVRALFHSTGASHNTSSAPRSQHPGQKTVRSTSYPGERDSAASSHSQPYFLPQAVPNRPWRAYRVVVSPIEV